MEGFGQTETTLTRGNFVGTATKAGSMGKPSPMYDVKLLLPDGTPAKTGEPGEICIDISKGAPCGLFKEYYRNKEDTEKVRHDSPLCLEGASRPFSVKFGEIFASHIGQVRLTDFSKVLACGKKGVTEGF